MLRQRKTERPETFARRIREKLQISQPKLAQLLGVHAKTVDGWEGGRQPSALAQQQLERLARRHNVEPPIAPPPRAFIGEGINADGQIGPQLVFSQSVKRGRPRKTAEETP